MSVGAAVDLLLIYPPWPVARGRARLISTLPPLGVLSIAASAEARGHRVAVCDAHAERSSLEDIRLLLRRLRPRVVGLSVLTSQATSAHAIARAAKEELPGCVVVAGGVHVEVTPERTLRNAAIDIVVRGDGEDAVVEILEGWPLERVLGASYRRDGAVRHNPVRPARVDLDSYPPPAWHLVSLDRYHPGATTYRQLPAINLLMTRGCPGRCSFCNSARTRLRSHSPERMVAQMELLHGAYGVRQFQFYDDTFTADEERVLRFCELLRERRLGVSWIGFIRGDRFSDRLAAAMSAAGCHQVLVGVETGSPAIAERIGKPLEPALYERAVRVAHRHGMQVRASFVLGSLGETEETMEQSLALALALDFDFVQLFVATPYPGTAMYIEAVERGWVRDEPWERYGQAAVLVDQPQLEADAIHRFQRRFARRFYLRPRVLKRLLRGALRPRQLQDYLQAVPTFLLGLGEDDLDEAWACWRGLDEGDYLDLPGPAQEPLLASHAVRRSGITA